MLLCPKCDKPIPPENINFSTDVAVCGGCRSVLSVSSVVRGYKGEAETDTPFDPAAAPPGTWYRDNGVETVVGATTRTRAAILLVVFFLAWSGGTLGGIYGSQVVSGKFDLVQSLFGLIFLAGSCALGSFALLSYWGRVEVTMKQQSLRVFVGVGSMGWSKTVDPATVKSVSEDWAGWSRGKRPQRSIVLSGATTIKFGSLLTMERRQFVMKALKNALRPA